MEHILPKLPYVPDALAPHISRETMEFHYGKHHQAYVDNLNKLIKGTRFANTTLEAIVKQAHPGVIFNNAAQAWNHAFFWQSMKPSGGGSPTGALAAAVARTWGSVDAFYKLFHALAIGIRVRQDMAREEARWVLGHGEHHGCTDTAHRWRQAVVDHRCVGTRLLHRLSQSAPEVRRGLSRDLVNWEFAARNFDSGCWRRGRFNEWQLRPALGLARGFGRLFGGRQ